jgi:hypothetical protein
VWHSLEISKYKETWNAVNTKKKRPKNNCSTYR